jgi:hypothetical protein
MVILLTDISQSLASTNTPTIRFNLSTVSWIWATSRPSIPSNSTTTISTTTILTIADLPGATLSAPAISALTHSSASTTLPDQLNGKIAVLMFIAALTSVFLLGIGGIFVTLFESLILLLIEILELCRCCKFSEERKKRVGNALDMAPRTEEAVGIVMFLGLTISVVLIAMGCFLFGLWLNEEFLM